MLAPSADGSAPAPSAALPPPVPRAEDLPTMLATVEQPPPPEPNCLSKFLHKVLRAGAADTTRSQHAWKPGQ